MKNISWKLVLVFAVVVAAVIYVLPTLYIDIWPHKKINLGLDLQGGMHLVLEGHVPQFAVFKKDGFLFRWNLGGTACERQSQ